MNDVFTKGLCMETIKTGVLGLAGTIGGVTASLNLASDILRFASLVVGLTIGLISLRKLLKSKKK